MPRPSLLRTTLRPLATTSSKQTLPSTTRRHISAYGYTQAKALTFPSYGSPPDVLRLHSHSLSPAHSNQIHIRFLASPINPADINQIQGVYPSRPTFTTTLGTPSPIAVGGNEGVAEVIAKGGAVTGLEKGDWVVMKGPGFGTWRTHAATTEDAVVKVDNRQGLSPTQVATVAINPVTASRMLKNFAALKEGDWVVQNGANSGVGRAVIQLARRWGIRTLNVVRARESGTEELEKDLKSLGADAVITDAELQSKESKEKVRELTGGAAIPLGMNCVNGAPALALSKLLAPSATLVTYGAMARAPLTVPASLLIFKDITYKGFWVSAWADRHPEERKQTIEEICGLMRSGDFVEGPVERVDWEWGTKEGELVKAVEGTLEGGRKGKGVFVFGET